jgi:hypothetical protein
VAGLTLVLGVSVAVAQPPAPPEYLARQSVRAVVLLVETAAAPTAAATAAPTIAPTRSLGERLLALMLARATRAATPVGGSQAIPALATAAPVAPVVASPTAASGEAPLEVAPDVPPVVVPTATPTATVAPTPTATLVPVSPEQRITAVGDSVMIGAVDQLQRAIGGLGVALQLDLDASLGRQVVDGIAILQARKDAGELGATVIVHVGSNGAFSDKQFDDLMAVLADVPRVVVVNVKVPRQWEEENNTVIAAGVERYANCRLVDWHSAVAEQPDLFWNDGTHLRPEGADVYADLIAGVISSP